MAKRRKGKYGEITWENLDHFRVDEGRVIELIGLGSPEDSPVAQELASTANPDFEIQEVINLVPFQEDVERIGSTAGRIYFREQRRLFAVTTSDYALRKLAERILEVMA